MTCDVHHRVWLSDTIHTTESDSAIQYTPRSLGVWISHWNRNQRKYFMLFIRGPDGFKSWKNRGRKSRDTLPVRLFNESSTYEKSMLLNNFELGMRHIFVFVPAPTRHITVGTIQLLRHSPISTYFYFLAFCHGKNCNKCHSVDQYFHPPHSPN